MISEQFIATYRQVGQFEVTNVDGVVTKNGGDVASYFCTPTGRVIHAVVGAVDSNVLLDEARWSLAAFMPVSSAPLKQQRRFVQLAHMKSAGRHDKRLRYARLPASSGHGTNVHTYLLDRPLAPLNSIYSWVFENLVGEQVGPDESRAAQFSRLLGMAERAKKPVLLVVHDQPAAHAHGWWKSKLRYLNREFQGLVHQYAVILVEPGELPALSQKMAHPDFSAPGGDRPLFIVAMPDGERIDAVSGWKTSELQLALAYGLTKAFNKKRPSDVRLKRAVNLVSHVDQVLAEELRSLLERSDSRS